MRSERRVTVTVPYRVTTHQQSHDSVSVLHYINKKDARKRAGERVRRGGAEMAVGSGGVGMAGCDPREPVVTEGAGRVTVCG